MFERFTERARQVVVLAQQEAREFQHNYIGTEHLFIALLAEEEGLAARVLEARNLSIGSVREYVRGLVGVGSEPTSGQIPFTPRAKKIFEGALREALSLGHNYIGTEHILLSIIRHDEGNAFRIMRYFNLDAEVIRNDVIAILSGPKGRAQQKTEQDEVRELQETVEKLRVQLKEQERAKLWTPAKTEEENLSDDGQEGWEHHSVRVPATFTYGDLTLRIGDATSGRVNILIRRPSGSLLRIS